MTSFHLCKNFYDRTLEGEFSNEVTIINGTSAEYSYQRLYMMFSIPGLDKGIDEDGAPLEAIRQVNTIQYK